MRQLRVARAVHDKCENNFEHICRVAYLTNRIHTIPTHIMKKTYIALLACALLPVAGAWQDDALAALAARVTDPAQLSPMRMLPGVPGREKPATLAQVAADNPILGGMEHWRNEVPELLQRTAATGDATLRSPHGFTALQAACLAGDTALISALVEKGAPVDARPAERSAMGAVGEAPLSLLTANTALPVEQMLPMASLLLEHGAAPDADALCLTWRGLGEVYTYHKKYAPLLFGGGREWEPRFSHLRLDLLLLEFGEQDYAKRFSPSGRISIPWWALNSAVRCRLLAGGAVPDARPKLPPGSLPSEKAKLPTLNHLVSSGDVEAVRLALQVGAHMRRDILFRIRTAEQPLASAPPDDVPYTPERAVEIAKLLLDHGADINALDWEGNGLRIHYGKQKGPIAEALCEYFKSRGAVLHPDAKPTKKRKK